MAIEKKSYTPLCTHILFQYFLCVCVCVYTTHTQISEAGLVECLSWLVDFMLILLQNSKMPEYYIIKNDLNCHRLVKFLLVSQYLKSQVSLICSPHNREYNRNL